MKKITLFVLLFSISFFTYSQCSNDGQKPSSGYPVCGNTQFVQTTVPLCPGKTIPTPCSGNQYTDINPYWYEFTCFKTGLFSFSIIPNDLNDDYDWQIFDITGRNPQDIYTDRTLIVSCNWSGNSGITGASSQGTALNNCAGFAYPTFSSMPVIKEGHTYLLLVSHFTISQSGYSLELNTDRNSTAVIVDPNVPALKSAYANCDGKSMYVVLNKKMKRSSLAANGSDFSIDVPGIKITGATPVSMNGFQMDTVLLSFSKVIPEGNSTISVVKGSDQNTLLDNCDIPVPEGKSTTVNYQIPAPTLIKDIVPLTCKPEKLELQFGKALFCNSLAADGSDFIVIGPSVVKVTGASGICSTGKTFAISIQLQGPIIVEGDYKIIIKRGSDGNTIIDECGQETPENNSIPFKVKSPVFADFTYETTFDCVKNTVQFNQTNSTGTTQWNWDIAGKKFDNPDPKISFTDYEKKLVTLTVTNGFCTDTKSQTIVFDNELRADFETKFLLCPEDSAVFKNKSIGKIISWDWDFDNGFKSAQQNPIPQKFPVIFAEKEYTVTLTVKTIQCSSTFSQKIKVLNSCYIAVPTAFTPNGDGLNDFLYPTNALKAKDLKFKVYNSWGQLVFSTKDWTQQWDGTINGNPQSIGTYVWTLEYTNEDTGKFIFQKGQTTLIR